MNSDMSSTRRRSKDGQPFPRKTSSEPATSKSFDVTCVVGTVFLDDNGTVPPHVAAFSMIAEHDSNGTYVFMIDDYEYRVTVERGRKA